VAHEVKIQGDQDLDGAEAAADVPRVGAVDHGDDVTADGGGALAEDGEGGGVEHDVAGRVRRGGHSSAGLPRGL
jgi:hypothetical protein